MFTELGVRSTEEKFRNRLGRLNWEFLCAVKGRRILASENALASGIRTSRIRSKHETFISKHPSDARFFLFLCQFEKIVFMLLLLFDSVTGLHPANTFARLSNSAHLAPF